MTEKILEIQQEILLIDRHKRQHVGNDGEIRQPNGSCAYCHRHRPAIEPPADGKALAEHSKRLKKKVGTLNEIERRVDVSGKNGCVLVPRTWSGKRVRIVLIDE